MEKTCEKCGAVFDGGEYARYCPHCLHEAMARGGRKTAEERAARAKAKRSLENEKREMAQALKRKINNGQYVTIGKRLALEIVKALEE